MVRYPTANPPLDPIRSQMHPICNVTSCILNIHIHVTLLTVSQMVSKLWEFRIKFYMHFTSPPYVSNVSPISLLI